jgi:hypothetical protein
MFGAVLSIALVPTAVTAAAAPAPATSAGSTAVVLIDGRNASDYTADHPLSLMSSRPVKMYVRLTNAGHQDSLSVRSVRFQGRVLGLAFVSYETEVDLKAAPGQTDTRSYRLDLVGLNRQATGLMPARIQLIDDHGRVVGARSFAVRVHGSLWSAYGVFGLAVALLSLLLIVGAVAALVRARQHRRRVQRALTFAVPGVGIATFAVFLLSATGALVPTPPEWIAFLAMGGVLGLAAGASTPTPYSGGHEAGASRPARPATDHPYSPLHSWKDAGLELTVPDVEAHRYPSASS